MPDGSNWKSRAATRPGGWGDRTRLHFGEDPATITVRLLEMAAKRDPRPASRLPHFANSRRPQTQQNNMVFHNTPALGIACVACLAFSSVAAEATAAQATFYVAPQGDDSQPGTKAKPFATIARARQAVQAINKRMSDDIVVVLRGGVYAIDKSVIFKADDSGTGGHYVIYRAESGETPVISGGRRIVGWTPDVNGRWKAPAPIDDFRQLYINGQRATRARGDAPAGLELEGEDAYTTTDVGMADWKNAGDLEFCYLNIWDHTRCKVQGIKRDGDRAFITMLQPHFTHAKTKEGAQVGNASQVQGIYMENALELLDEPGEWYIDRESKTVYYMPRDGEDLTKAEVIVPALERLVEMRGTLDRPVSNLQFQGITFAHGSWLRPSEIGFVDVQANFVLDWKNPLKREGGLFAVHNEHVKTPSNIVCHAVRAIRFDRCTFTKLGSGAIDLEYGSQDNTIVACHFYDISGSAVQVGDVLKDDHHPDDPRKIVKNNAVVNNYIHDCGVDYWGSVGVFAGYTESTVIAHNEIARMPYSGVSMGWGWGEEDAGGGPDNYYQPFRYDTPTPAKNNRVEYNHIHHVAQKLNDTGAVYTLGNQPDAIVCSNHIHDIGGDCPGLFSGLYPDEGSGFIEFTGNLVYGVIKPLHCNNQAQNRIATCNIHDNYLGSNPDEAAPIIAKAGLEANYRDLLENP